MGTVVAMVVTVGLLIYCFTAPVPDYSSIRFLVMLLVLMPVLLAIAYLIRLFIESLAR